MSTTKWTKFSEKLPPENLIVDTKIEDEKGSRNQEKLIRRGNLMWTTDLKMYVYYSPTHWKLN